MALLNLSPIGAKKKELSKKSLSLPYKEQQSPRVR